MSFDWAEYLSVAEDLYGVPVSGPLASAEARQRASVSRAYYAAYILARNHLRDVDGVRIPHNASSHRFVAAQFADDPDPVRIRIGQDLARLRTIRNRCDYDDVVVNLANVVILAIRRSSQIIADLARL